MLVVADLKPEKTSSRFDQGPGLGCCSSPVSSLWSLVLLGGHSEVDPRLPIPNRTVKRLCADASADCPRESRSPPGAPKTRSPSRAPGEGLCVLRASIGDLLSERKHTPRASASKRPTPSAYEGSALTGVCFSAGSCLAGRTARINVSRN